MSFNEKYNLKKIINASGTMTALGASRVSAEVISAMSEILPAFVEMKQLQIAASKVIARATGAESGCVTASAASGISIAVAACMTGMDFYKIEMLPDSEGMKNEVIIQKGHAVSFGSSVTQMVRLSGARCVEIGTATLCGTYQLKGAINEKTAAALYVVSHHTVQSGLIQFEEFARVARENNIPVIVDAASEYDLMGFLEKGADIVVYSGHKFLGGPTSGIIAGKKKLVKACYYQEKGIGRGMKVGKESILGAMEALEQWLVRDPEEIRKQEEARIEYAFNFLNKLEGFNTTYSKDPTHNPIARLKVEIDPEKSTLSAYEIQQLLSQGDPSIKVRNHHVDLGYFFLDPCNLLDGEIEIVCDRIKELIEHSVKKEHKAGNLADIEVNSLLQWPD